MPRDRSGEPWPWAKRVTRPSVEPPEDLKEPESTRPPISRSERVLNPYTIRHDMLDDLETVSEDYYNMVRSYRRDWDKVHWQDACQGPATTPAPHPAHCPRFRFPPSGIEDDEYFQRRQGLEDEIEAMTRHLPTSVVLHDKGRKREPTKAEAHVCREECKHLAGYGGPGDVTNMINRWAKLRRTTLNWLLMHNCVSMQLVGMRGEARLRARSWQGQFWSLAAKTDEAANVEEDVIRRFEEKYCSPEDEPELWNAGADTLAFVADDEENSQLYSQVKINFGANMVRMQRVWRR